MKYTKQRRHRKAVTFYTTCFGFRKPFKVLCDGTFIYNLIANRVAPADKAISNTLSAPVKLFTTRCVIEEVRRLGSSHSDTLAAARSLAIASCDHEDKTKADSCILDVVKENNPEHFFVATQDADLRKNLQEIPGVPVMFGLRNSLFLEQPSPAQRKFVEDSEEKRSHVTEKEWKILKKRTGVILASMDPEHSDGEEDVSCQSRDIVVAEKMEAGKKGLSVKDKPQFKRKKAKGPNPLSCLKKKKKPASEKEKGVDENCAQSRSTKRKRSRKHKSKLLEVDS